MKLRKNILILLIFISIIGIPISEVKAWGNNDHKERVAQVISTRLGKVYFSNEEIQLLYKAISLAELDDYRNPNGVYAGNLHGRGNYIATMKYLYELAFKYLDNQSKVNDTSFINNYFKSCSYLTKSERQNIAIVNSSLIKLVTTKIIYTSSDYELSNRKKAIKILGFVCHLTGDIYAHDTIVPNKAVSYNKYDSLTSFRQSDFISTSRYSSLVKWSTFKTIICNYKISFFDLDNLNTVSVTNKSGANIKLKNIYDENLLYSIACDLKANRFEDNPKFHSTRFDATFTVTKEILTKFNTGLLAKDNAKKLDGTFNKNIVNYYSKYTNSSYQLRNFESFYSVIK